MLRKRIIALLLVCCFMTISTCFAATRIPDSKMSIGGIGFDSSLGYVKAVYGEPSSIKRYKGGDVYVVRYNYNNLLEFCGRTSARYQVPEDDIKICGYVITANNLATPDGFRVGDSYSKVTNIYGKGELLESRYAPKDLPGCKYYYYGIGREMSFAVDKKGKIAKISVATEL